MPRFRLKAGILEAMQYLREDNISSFQYFFEKVGDNGKKLRYQPTLNEYGVLVKDPDGEKRLHILERGEYVIRNLDGSYTVMREDEFLKKYEVVEE